MELAYTWGLSPHVFGIEGSIPSAPTLDFINLNGTLAAESVRGLSGHTLASSDLTDSKRRSVYLGVTDEKQSLPG